MVHCYKFGYLFAFERGKGILHWKVDCSIWIVLESHQLHIVLNNRQNLPRGPKNSQQCLVLKWFKRHVNESVVNILEI